MFIVYLGNDEVIVTTEKKEKKTIKIWFKDGDRDLEEYDREEVSDPAVELCSRISVS